MKIGLLIVEDDPDARGIMHTLISLKMPELEIFLADNGTQGLAICRDHAPDIVITDINMPDMDGIRMAGEIWALKRDTRFIVLTGYTDRIKEFGDIPLHEYLVKPADLRKLLEALNSAIGEIKTGTSN